jgi:hypothetical protein
MNIQTMSVAFRLDDNWTISTSNASSGNKYPIHADLALDPGNFAMRSMEWRYGNQGLNCTQLVHRQYVFFFRVYVAATICG